MNRSLFVTGMLRSGTTLVDKLLSSHPQILVASQPLPCLYTHLAGCFLGSGMGGAAADSKFSRRYPLGDLFGSTHYSIEDFTGFLKTYSVSRAEWRTILENLRRFSGTMTEIPQSFGPGWRRPSLGTPDQLIRDYLEILDGAAGVRMRGSKETLCEQFAPYLLDCGVDVLVVVRDIRDVISSLDSGRGEAYGGRRKPLLFNIRQWRKSIAFALGLRGRRRFHLIRYEDLVRDPDAVCNSLFRRLGLEGTPHFHGVGELRDPISGEAWPGNSSFGVYRGVSEGSVDSHREQLPAETVRVIEAACLPELVALGYACRTGPTEVEAILECPWYDHSDVRPELAGYRWSETRRDEEIDRWRGLREDRFMPEYHLDSTAFDSLRAGLGFDRPGVGGNS